MRSYVIKLKKYYDMGIYTYDAIVALYDKGKITEEELEQFVDYVIEGDAQHPLFGELKDGNYNKGINRSAYW